MDIIKILTYVVMFAGLVAVIWGIKNLNKTSNGRIIMIVGAVILFAGVGVNIVYSWPTKEKALDQVAQTELAFRTAKAEKGAQYIADRAAGGTVAMLIDEASYSNAESDSRVVLDEMQKRLAEKGLTCDKVLTIKLIEEDGENTKKSKSGADPEETFGKNLNKVLNEVRDKVDFVVNFAGLPKSIKGFKEVKFLQAASSAGKNNMLLMTDAGLDYVNQSMIESGRVSAIIEYSATEEGANFNAKTDKAPKDIDKAFSIRYYLINADSLADFNSMENDTYFVNK